MDIKSSIYNYCVRSERQRYLIWNTLSDAMISIDRRIYRALFEGDLSVLPEDILKMLQDTGVLIASDRNELSELEEDLMLRSSGQDLQSGGFFRILTTTACNAACPYCYENDLHANTMDEETAHRTADFIIHNASEKSPCIEWFGGEPLFNHKAISVICNDLAKADVPFVSKITTNGSLWTDELIKASINEWNLHNVQITLDGLGEEHDRLKRLPAGTFRLIVRRIRELAHRKIRVRIRINHFAGQNHLPLVSWLTDEFSTEPFVHAYVTPGYRPGKEHPATLIDEIFRLNLILKNSGMAYKTGRFLPARVRVGCYACNPHNYTVSPEGRLYGCAHIMSDEQCVGDVCRGAVYLGKTGFIRKNFSERCSECILLPVCMGGCRVAETGAAAMTQCPPFKGSIPELIRYEAISRKENGRLSYIDAGDQKT